MIVHYYKFMVSLFTLQEDPAAKRSSTVIFSNGRGRNLWP